MKDVKKDFKIDTKFLLYSVIIFLIGDLFVLNTSWKDEYLSTKSFWVFIFSFVFVFLFFATEGIKKLKEKKFLILIGLLSLMVMFNIISTYKNPFWGVLKPNEIIFGALDRGEGFHLWIVYIIFMVTGYIVVYKNRKNLMIINNVLVLSGAVVAFDGILQYVFGKDLLFLLKKPIEKYTYCFSLWGNQNFVGNFLVLILPISIILYVKSNTKVKYFYLVAVLLEITCLFCTRTRGAWLGAIIPLLFIVVKSLKNRKIINILVMIFISMGIILSVNHLSGSSITTRVSSIVQDANLATKGDQAAGSKRVLLWEKTIHFIKKRPIWGWGPNSMSSLIIISDEDSQKYWGIKNAIMDKCHNEYLQIAYDSGVQSLLIYIAFLFYLIFRKFKILLKDDISLGLALGVIGYSCALFFNFSIMSTHSWFFMIIGMLACEVLNNGGEKSLGKE